MQLYALKIRKSDLALLTVLNGGVTPKVEKKPTYFILSIEGADTTSTKIVTEREFYQTYEIKSNSPLLFALKK